MSVCPTTDMFTKRHFQLLTNSFSFLRLSALTQFLLKRGAGLPERGWRAPGRIKRDVAGERDLQVQTVNGVRLRNNPRGRGDHPVSLGGANSCTPRRASRFFPHRGSGLCFGRRSATPEGPEWAGT